MRSLWVLVLILMWTATASAAANISASDVQWGDNASSTLYRGDTLMNGEYTVKAVEFSSPVPGVENVQGNVVPGEVVYPMVDLEVYKNGALVNTVVMKLGDEPYVDADYNYRISVTDFPERSSKEWVYEYYKPWADVSFQLRAGPELIVNISTDKTTYISNTDSEIDATVQIINSGDAFVKNVELRFDPGELKVIGGDLKETYVQLDASSVQSFRVKLAVPETDEDRTYTLSADASAYDAAGNQYTFSGSLPITITPISDNFIVTKAFRDRIYLGDNDTVHVKVSNGGLYDITGIVLQDSIDENFELVGNSPLQWNIPILKPGQEWETEYTITPLEANLQGFDIPEATAKYTVNNEQRKVSSETKRLIVNGPLIVLNKTVDMDYAYTNETVTVTVSINNIGDMPTKIDVKDSIPEGVSLVSGTTSLGSTFLELNSPQEFSYVIRRNTEGKVQLSAAVANYTDIVYRGTKTSQILSDMPTVTFIDTSKPKPASSVIPKGRVNASGLQKGTGQQSTQQSTAQTPMVPGFEIILAIAVLLLAAALKHK